MYPKKACESSGRCAQSIARAEVVKRILLLVLVVCAVTTLAKPAGAEAGFETVVQFDIPRQRADLALTQFAEQAGLTLLFPFDGIRERMANKLEGEYLLDEAIERLLAGTGLMPTFRNALVLDIAIDDTAANEGKAMKTSKTGSAVAVLASILTAGVNAQEISASTNTEAGAESSVISGQVNDARTGANLKGAKLTIEETGEWTQTDGLGRYRFAAVAPGDYTLTVSFLGYASQSMFVSVGAGVAKVQAFALSGDGELEEIVVFGTRSARAQALNQERTAANVSTVVSSDLLGNFTGTTISEALRRMPGVAFQQDPLTGAGTNIIVRGLEPDFNTVKLNGMELPVGNGQGRSADLSNLLADSVESITIHKSLLPSHDSGGTGGLIEIETKSPLDRSRRYMNFLVENAERGSDFSDDLLVSGTLSGSFGEGDTLGLSASVQYRDQTNTNIGFEMTPLFGQHLPLDAAGTTRVLGFGFVDPATPFPWEDSADDVYVIQSKSEVNDVSTENLAVTLSTEWQPADHTNLRLDYQHSASESRTSMRLVNFNDRSRYSEQPVESLGGESRRALAWGGFGRNSIIYSRTDTESETDVLSFRGVTDLGPWQASYDAGYTIGESRTPERRLFSVSAPNFALAPYVLPEALDPVEGRIVTLFGERRGNGVQLPLMTQAGFDLIGDMANYSLGSAMQTTRQRGENERYAGGFTLRRSFDHPQIRYLEAGLAYEGSRFQAVGRDTPLTVRDNGADLAALGLALDDTDLSRIGVDGGIRTVSQGVAERFLNEVFTQAETDPSLDLRPPRTQDPLLRQAHTEEDEFAAYLETQLDFGDWELIGGVRATRVRVTAVNRTGPFFVDEDGNDDLEFAEEFTRLVTQSATQTDVLPRFLVNYRPTENLVFRGSYHLSVARPRVSQLSAEQRIKLELFPDNGPNRDQPKLEIDQGNPDLDPTTTDNYDLSIEYYDKRIGVVKLGAFYKRMKDFIQSNGDVDSSSLEGVELPDDPRFLPENLPANLFIDRSQPENSEDPADLWGVELAVERQLTFLPGIWNGLGVFANYTYSDSSKTVFVPWNEPQFDGTGSFTGYERQVATFDDVAFDQQPKESGTLALTYNKYGLDATVAYSYQDRRLGVLSVFPRFFNDSVDSLDFRFEYRFELGGGDFRVYFEGANVLDGNDDPATLSGRGGEGSTPEVIRAGTYLGGREFRLGFASTF